METLVRGKIKISDDAIIERLKSQYGFKFYHHHNDTFKFQFITSNWIEIKDLKDLVLKEGDKIKYFDCSLYWLFEPDEQLKYENDFLEST